MLGSKLSWFIWYVGGGVSFLLSYLYFRGKTNIDGRIIISGLFAMTGPVGMPILAMLWILNNGRKNIKD